MCRRPVPRPRAGTQSQLLDPEALGEFSPPLGKSGISPLEFYLEPNMDRHSSPQPVPWGPLPALPEPPLLPRVPQKDALTRARPGPAAGQESSLLHGQRSELSFALMQGPGKDTHTATVTVLLSDERSSGLAGTTLPLLLPQQGSPFPEVRSQTSTEPVDWLPAATRCSGTGGHRA